MTDYKREKEAWDRFSLRDGHLVAMDTMNTLKTASSPAFYAAATRSWKSIWTSFTGAISSTG